MLAVAHGLFGDALAAVLRAQPGFDLIQVTHGCGELMDEESLRHADVALLDSKLAVRTGIPLGRLVEEFSGGLPTLLLNQPAERPVAVATLVGGLRGYLTCDATVSELIVSIRAVAHGQIVVPVSKATGVVVELVASEGRRIVRKAEALTGREQAVLELLLRGTSPAAIARRLSISTVSARTHVASVLRKLRVRSRLEGTGRPHPTAFGRGNGGGRGR